MKKTGIIFLAVGFSFIFIQNTFYGYVDAEGILRDSIFLPAGVFATIIGIIFLGFWAGRIFYKRLRGCM